MKVVPPFQQAAQSLFQAHERRERFQPLPEELAPRTEEDAYAIQDAFVALRAQKLGAIAGYKITPSSAEMRRFAGVDHPLAGALLESTLRRAPASVRAADYLHLLVEFEIAVQIADDLPAADAPFFRDRVAKAVGAVMPAFELADDRNADDGALPTHPFDLIADNCWNEGVVLGDPVKDWQALDLAALRAVASVNGSVVGEGRGADAMGHPFDAVAWIADHLARHGRGLLRGDVVMTGSLITSRFPSSGDVLKLSLEGLSEVELHVD